MNCANSLNTPGDYSTGVNSPVTGLLQTLLPLYPTESADDSEFAPRSRARKPRRSEPRNHDSKFIPQYRIISIRSCGIPALSSFRSSRSYSCAWLHNRYARLSLPLQPQARKSPPSSSDNASEGWDMIAPAFFIIFTSPFLMPKEAGSNSVSRVSMQDTMAIFLSGYLFVIYFSYPLVLYELTIIATNSSIIAFGDLALLNCLFI